jgi:hypothetical protein
MTKRILPSVARTLSAAYSPEELRSFGISDNVEAIAKQPSAKEAKAMWKRVIAKLNAKQDQLLNGS